MKELFVYILRCTDGSYYTGVTNDVERRLDEHQRGISLTCYTWRRRPVVLVYISSPYREWADAINWEKTLKGWSRKKKEALINQEYEKLPELAKKKFPKLAAAPPCHPE